MYSLDVRSFDNNDGYHQDDHHHQVFTDWGLHQALGQPQEPARGVRTWLPLSQS